MTISNLASPSAKTRRPLVSPPPKSLETKQTGGETVLAGRLGTAREPSRLELQNERNTMNSITLSGHLTHDPELVHRGERAVCEMRLAVDNGNHPTTYVDVVTFDDQAYVCAEYMAKGKKIGVEGRLLYREWRGP